MWTAHTVAARRTLCRHVPRRQARVAPWIPASGERMLVGGMKATIRPSATDRFRRRGGPIELEDVDLERL